VLTLRVEELGLALPVVRQARAARRLRLAVPGAHPEALVRRCAVALSAVPGVLSVRADALTGRILVEYAPRSPLLAGLALEQQPAQRSGRAPADGLGRILRRLRRPASASPLSAARDPWHSLLPEEVLARLDASRAGLDDRAARIRRAHCGANEYDPYQPPSRLKIFARQLANLPAALLLGFSAVELAVQEWIDAALIDAVVGMNAAIGYRIEAKNEELLESWRRLETGEARVLRSGEVRGIPAAELVPGDVLLCETGDILPADARVLDAHRLTTNEAPLTGESEPQLKRSDPVAEATPLAERTCMLYAGTAVVSGRGRAVVTGTGSATELAQVRALVDEARAPETPLELRMEQLGRQATAFSVAAASLTAALGLAHGRPVAPVLRSAIALGVAAIPEGLPLVVTAAIVRCMRRMRATGLVVRRMASVEALGGVTVICADKTGTLTANDMRLELLELGEQRISAGALRADGGPFSCPAAAAIATAILSSDLDMQDGPDGLQVTGSATERAFANAAARAGMDVTALRRIYPRLKLQERGDGAHYVVSLHDTPEGDRVACIKGAPEQVLQRCERGVDGAPLDERSRSEALARNDALATEGLRMLALGWQRLPAGATLPQSGFTYLGLAGLCDPLRPGAAQAVQDARRARIRTLILTGDQRATAAAIARQVGLRGEARDGAEMLRHIRDDHGVDEILRSVTVLSRVTPADKMQIVKALRDRGEIVAMVGDGINDAAALKAADVGIAVGAHASGIARQTADIVMPSEDLRSILAAVGEGRIVQDNLRRTVRFIFTTNLSEILLQMAGAALGRDIFSPMQLLWVNLLTDTVPALALALEPGEPGVLDREPAPPRQPMVRAEEWRRIGRDAALLAAYGAAASLAGGPGAAFAALPAVQLSYARLCRADGAPAHGGFATMLAGSAAAHLAVITLPGLRRVLRLPAPTAGAMIGFAAGIAWPWLLGGLGDEFVLKGNGGAAPPLPSRGGKP
jgi:Ca2+-transporting ATPase